MHTLLTLLVMVCATTNSCASSYRAAVTNNQYHLYQITEHGSLPVVTLTFRNRNQYGYFPTVVTSTLTGNQNILHDLITAYTQDLGTTEIQTALDTLAEYATYKQVVDCGLEDTDDQTPIVNAATAVVAMEKNYKKVDPGYRSRLLEWIALEQQKQNFKS